jgi:hypothetical protein
VFVGIGYSVKVTLGALAVPITPLPAAPIVPPLLLPLPDVPLETPPAPAPAFIPPPVLGLLPLPLVPTCSPPLAPAELAPVPPGLLPTPLAPPSGLFGPPPGAALEPLLPQPTTRRLAAQSATKLEFILGTPLLK